MNTSLTAYTHLESLLLFQSLHAYGLTPSVFSSVSELLKNNPHIAADKRFQSGRLSPDALRNFYLHILKDEVKSEQSQADADGLAASSGPRKRKAPSPSLPTVHESLQHQHLIPKLVNKLYARYRSAIASEIRQDEDRYERLQRDIQAIERGEWDQQLTDKLHGQAPSASQSPRLPKKSPVPPPPPPSQSQSQSQPPSQPVATPPARVQEATEDALSPSKAPVVTHGQEQPVSEPSQRQRPSPQDEETQATHAPKRTPRPSPRKKKTSPDHWKQPSTPQPPLAPLASPQSHATQPLPLKQPAPAEHAASPNPHPSPHPPPVEQPPSHANTPTPVQPTAQPQNQPPGPYPRPPSAATPSGTPHLPQLAQKPGGHYGAPIYPPPSGPSPQLSPTHQRMHAPQSGQQSPAVQTPQPRNLYPYPGHLHYPPQQPQIGHPPPQGGFMLPPFQVSPQEPARAASQQAPPPHHPHLSTPMNPRQQPLAKASASVPGPSRAGMPPMHHLITQARSAFSTPLSAPSPYTASGTPRSAKTLWKPSAKNFTAPPAPRPVVSPIDDVPPALKSQQSTPKAKTTRKSRARPKGKPKQAENQPGSEPPREAEQSEETVAEPEARQGRSRRKTASKKTRPGSIASSKATGSLRDRSRSQSILSHTETLPADNESQAGDRVKSERGTSIDAIDEEPVATPSHRPTRRKGGAAQPLQPNNKRKRLAREASPEESEEPTGTPGPPRTVTALRHFSRMCNPIMNDIGSHKHASTFTTAVKAKDAEGYYDIIKAPTDLKTIQKAIATGGKVVAAAASDTPAGSPGVSGGGATIELPMTPETLPPKAIVNSSQLEKELMRMFVNAVMFNAGEEGVVKDAREMFETVQRSVSTWRNVERASGRMDAVEDNTPTVGEEQDEQAEEASVEAAASQQADSSASGPAPKRRKL